MAGGTNGFNNWRPFPITSLVYKSLFLGFREYHLGTPCHTYYITVFIYIIRILVQNTMLSLIRQYRSNYSCIKLRFWARNCSWFSVQVYFNWSMGWRLRNFSNQFLPSSFKSCLACNNSLAISRNYAILSGNPQDWNCNTQCWRYSLSSVVNHYFEVICDIWLWWPFIFLYTIVFDTTWSKAVCIIDSVSSTSL